jgi:cytoskeletal protein CcmA (bactofilin family)
MALFGREQQPPAKSVNAPAPAPAPSSASKTATLVAPGTKIVGKISGSAEVMIDGELEGELRVDGGAVIGTGGTVRGEIAARTVRVGGKVFGNIRGGERVEVLASGALEGDVSAPRVVIAEGAFFKGKVEMTGGKSDEKK